MLRTFEEVVLSPLVGMDHYEPYLLLKHPAPIRTWQLLDFFADVKAGAAIRFVIGEDLIKEVDTWERYDYIYEKYGFHVVPDSGVHATHVREMVAAHEPAWKCFVLPEVANYIKLHGLYGCNNE